MTEQEKLIQAFVDGAKWWEYKKTGFTMWKSDQEQARQAAEERIRIDEKGEDWTRSEKRRQD